MLYLWTSEIRLSIENWFRRPTAFQGINSWNRQHQRFISFSWIEWLTPVTAHLNGFPESADTNAIHQNKKPHPFTCSGPFRGAVSIIISHVRSTWGKGEKWTITVTLLHYKQGLEVPRVKLTTHKSFNLSVNPIHTLTQQSKMYQHFKWTIFLINNLIISH